MNFKRLLRRGAVSLGVVTLGMAALAPAATRYPATSCRGASPAGTGAAPDRVTRSGYTGTLHVQGSGFGTSLNTVFAIECVHNVISSDQCDANTADGSVNADTSGNYNNPAYTYYSLPNATFGGVDSITCDATHLCDLVLIQDDYNNFSNPHVNIPLTFDSGVATPETPWLPILPLGGVVIAGAGYLIWRKRQHSAALAA